MKSELVPIAIIYQSSVAYLVLSCLENEGVQCFLDATVSKMSEDGANGTNVLICKTQIKKAFEIISNFISHLPLNSVKLIA
ncbi:MAG: hypothetical protein WCP69_11160 [Bacteroidota bacterium]|jgi:hypothetical protein